MGKKRKMAKSGKKGIENHNTLIRENTCWWYQNAGSSLTREENLILSSL